MKIIKLFLAFILVMTFCNPSHAGDIAIEHKDGIYHIVLKGEKIKKRIKFVTSEDLITNKEAHERAKSTLTVNAGAMRK